MTKKTQQINFWNSSFGQEYTDRNTFNNKSLDDFYKNTFGVTRTEMNAIFLKNLKIKNILEAGCNIGIQLNKLQEHGYSNLYGIELQQDAVEKSKQFTKNINIIQGSIFDIPFKDKYFDLVFTSGILIHLHPKDYEKAIDEIYRCSRKYLWGFEYFAKNCEEIKYRGNKNVLWKNNFSEIYLKQYPNLKLIKEKKYKYKNSNNIDVMYLLEK